jgi:tetratricopeptide (TPR) repeat protein
VPQPASTASETPASSHDPQQKAELAAMLGVPYAVLGNDLESTHRLAYQEMTEGYDRFFRDGGKVFDTEQAPRARELFESAVRRVDDLKQRRAQAWRTLPILFVELDYVVGKAENGLVMVAFSRLDHDEISRQLTRMLDVSDRAFNTIAQELRGGVIRTKPPRYQELKDDFAGLITKAHLMLGMESKRRGEIELARAHYQKSLEYATDDDLRRQLRSLLDGQ